ncbi:hypothetical protein BGC07_00855 [Piscirickettsia litoralis]|uniref:Methyltransferase domain-containing protein n=2 Tax=Piscirickettsia litoralis TaxID=1891921 RepID=A0ABX2ZZY6_9GAMM|nr:hypothetical protein BGC07_00855 [Piscirickettsia litoralis]
MNFNDKASIYDKIASSQNEAADILYQEIINTCALVDTANVLDLGCGTGYLSRKLSDEYSFVTGIDISEEMLQQASDQGGNVDYALRDAAELNEHLEYDLITANSLTYYISDLPTAFKSYYNALKPGGYFALQSQTALSPQFVRAFHSLKKNAIAKPFIDGFKLLANMQCQQKLSEYIQVAGFRLILEKTRHFRTRCTPEKALDIFKAGTATPLLNPKGYDRKLTSEYKKLFWQYIQESIESQSIDNQFTLEFSRVFIIAVK